MLSESLNRSPDSFSVLARSMQRTSLPDNTFIMAPMPASKNTGETES